MKLNKLASVLLVASSLFTASASAQYFYAISTVSIFLSDLLQNRSFEVHLILKTHFLVLQEQVVQIEIVSMIVQQMLVQLQAALQEKYRILLMMQNVLTKRHVTALKNYLLIQILVQLVLRVRNKIL